MTDKRPEPPEPDVFTQLSRPAPDRTPYADQAKSRNLIDQLTTGAERPAFDEEFIGNEEQRVAFYSDFITAQGVFDEIITNQTGKISYKAKGDREGGSFTFKYADLAQVIKATRKHLCANGLGVMQPLVEYRGGLGLKTILMHKAGGRMECTIPLLLGGLTEPKDQAGIISYWRRYTIGAWLWLASEEDIDGQKKEVPDKLIVDAYLAAESGVDTYKKFWQTRDEESRDLLMSRHEKLKAIAIEADGPGQ